MSDKTILELTDIGTLQGTDVLPMARAGVVADNGTTVGAINDYVKSDADTTPTSSSNKLITSGGVKTELDKCAAKATSATEGNVAVFDASGNSVDSGSGIETTPTENSDKLAKSGGIWSWVTGLINGIREWANSTFAKIDGWYSTLVAGAAENLVGHGSVGAEYTFRTSGGTADIGTGAATIDVLKGKTLKWNQLVNTTNFTNTALTNGSWSVVGMCKYKIVVNSGGLSDNSIITGGAVYVPSSHKVYIKVTGDVHAGITFRIDGTVNVNPNIIYTTTTDTAVYPRLTPELTEGEYNIYINIIDLTEMFGAGNEPTTVAEFEALYPLDYYDYTATPVLINNAASGIVTTGFNQWDEEWENGRISGSGNGIKSKNYIPVFGGQQYHFISGTYTGGTSVLIYEFDSQKRIITSYENYGLKFNFTPSANCCYILFCIPTSTAVTTYNHDICINISWSGYRNGEYEPYEKHTLYFNGENGSLATVTGKKLISGVPTGESVTIFPDGMKSAGSVYDFGKADSDGYIRKVTKRIYAADLGDLTWSRLSDEVRLAAQLPTELYPIGSINYQSSGGFINSKYTEYTGAYNNATATNLSDKMLSVYTSGSSVYVVVKDSSITTSTPSEIQAALSGIKFYFYLPTPEEYLLDTPIPANYIVNDFGTEQRIPEDTASSVMAPILYDVQYSMNAVDTLRRLPVNYISVDSMEQYLAARGTLDGGTWSMSWDSEHERYNFSFTPTEEQQQEGA